jgi:hypothetical protein
MILTSGVKEMSLRNEGNAMFCCITITSYVHEMLSFRKPGDGGFSMKSGLGWGREKVTN